MPKPRWFRPSPFLPLTCFGLVLCAHVFAAAVPAPPHPPIQAARASSEMRCDGVLDEASWATAPPVSEFYQQTPDQGAAATMKSDFRILFDDNALYIGARLYDPSPDSIRANIGRRDTSLPADRITVYVDPFHDKRSGYLFVVNAAGHKVDGLLYNDGVQDLTWDGVWEGRSHRDSLGWTAELRIPFSQLRFQSGAEPVWGINFKRVIVRRGEESLIAYTPRDGSGFNSRFPDLVGLSGIQSSRSIEISPYVTGKSSFLRHDANDPFNDGSQMNGRTGLDLRAPVGRRLTLNATVNPDFGQVEVDPAVVNLSDVESTFQEKRPYFVEGASNFNFGREGSSSYWNFNWPEPRFFYSRRIGRAPQGGLPANDFADVPIATTILGAAKLTGKITPSTNFGTLQALTGREDARLVTGGIPSKAEVEPLTYYEVTRALKEFKDRRAGIGLLSTAVVRRFDDTALENQLNSTSLLAGTDGWLFLDPKKMWVLSGWAAGSNVQGTSTRITSVQRSSRHYFQRPDASSVEVNPAATALTGGGGRLWLNKQSGRIMSNTGIGVLSPGFEVNDLGIQSRSDVINGHSMLGYQWTKDTRFTRYANVWGALVGSRNFDGDLTYASLAGGGNLNYKNNWSSWWDAGANPRYTDVRSTRGGPKMKAPRDIYFGAGFNTNSYKKAFLSTWFNIDATDVGGFSRSGGFYVEWKPKSNLLVSAGPSLSVGRVDAQYVTTTPDPSATETFGNRYVFARLDQTTLATDVRVNWTFTPNLSFETYLQPFVSSGTYTGYKSLAAPNTYTFDPYAFSGNSDFRLASLRGNAVLRWEYSPGSALFLVWTQQRADFEPVGDFDFRHSLSRLMDQRGDNVFLVKLSYHMAL
ncbi:MAG TPA: DUF5916 domain-containing protein [Candidatus Eisenbacteria bacterium]|nr:DUF5916 domain-containing protein [Candidatus Eisenbacteria bacterium]